MANKEIGTQENTSTMANKKIGTQENTSTMANKEIGTQENSYNEILIRDAEFLVKLFADPRVDVNQGNIHTVVGFFIENSSMKSIESLPLESQQSLVTRLLKPYDKPLCELSNWILMRMWHGCGFAFRYTKSPHLTRNLGLCALNTENTFLIHQTFDPCPSSHYQQLVSQMLKQDQHMAAEFRNSVLETLNWTFSKFITEMQEIQNLSKLPDALTLRKGVTYCFDFIICLLRVLEMVCTNCPQVFTDLTRENTENLLKHLTQLLSQILLSVTTPTGSFNHVISLGVPDLDSIDQFPVLSAVAGVLLALLAEDIACEEDRLAMSVAARCLLSEPAFQIETLKYVLGETKSTNEKKESFSFRNYPEAVSEAELEQVAKLVSVLTKYKNHMSVVSEVEDEDLLCPICCALPLTATFTPCSHQSCKSCITRHLMNSKTCFFCKATIMRVTAVDGSLIFDATPSSDSIVQTSSNL